MKAVWYEGRGLAGDVLIVGEGGPVFWAPRRERAQLEAELHELARESGQGFVLADLTPLLEG